MAKEQSCNQKYTNYQDEEMEFFSADKKKILILKFGALGDIVRTTPILLGIKKKYPSTIIYWLTKESSKELLQNNPLIDKILVYNLDNVLRLKFEKFDILFSLEIDPPSTILAKIVKAKEKYGYYFSEDGATKTFNEGAKEYLDLACNDELKKSNKKSYQELIFQASNLKYENEPYVLSLSEKEYAYANQFKLENKINDEDNLIGINISCGERWMSKLWSEKKLKELIRALAKTKTKIILLGGPNESDKIKKIKEEFEKEGILILTNNPSNTLKEFISIINLCKIIITTDSLALHLALALKKNTIALFFSTPKNEIKDENFLKKIQSPLYEKYFFSKTYSEELANSISVEQVLEKIKSFENE